MGFNYETVKPAHLVPFLNLTYLLSIPRVDGREGFSTYWIKPFVVDKNLQEKSQVCLHIRKQKP